MENKKLFPRRKRGIRQLRRWEERLMKILMKMKSVVKFQVKNSKITENREAVIEMFYENRCLFYS